MFTSSSLAALIATLVAYPTVASVVPDMPWFANTGVSGLLGFLLWWHMERGDKRTSKGVDDLKDEISGMRSDLKEGQAKTNALLERALFDKKGAP
jgi:flagellar biosynthesis component FlhA